MFKKLNNLQKKRLVQYKDFLNDLLNNPKRNPQKKFWEWFQIIFLVETSNGYHSGSRARIILNRIEKLYQQSI